MSPADFEYDLFISYARENRQWVQDNLIEPLKGCRTEFGKPVKVFLDVESIRIAANWMERTTEAINRSRVLVALYSKEYFDPARDYCHLELVKGSHRDPLGVRKMFFPLAIGPDVPVPDAYGHLQWLDTTQAGWFEKLVNGLGYRHHGRIHTLHFKTFLTSVIAGEPMSEIQVALEYGGDRVEEDEVIRLISENGTLRGEVVQTSVRGLARFTELYFDAPQESTRLVATADGCTAAFSDPFTVTPAPTTIATAKEDPWIDAQGEGWFCSEDEVLVIAESGTAKVFAVSGAKLGEACLPRHVRFVKRCAKGIVFCGWSGQIVWIGPHGEARSWQLSDGNGVHVIGDIVSASATTSMLAGMWSGEVFRLDATGRTELEFRHPDGVQALAAHNDHVFLADMDGYFSIYVGGRPRARLNVERAIHLVKVFENCVILVGENHLYQYSFEQQKVFTLPILETIGTVYEVEDKALAVSRQGRGMLIVRDRIAQTLWLPEGSVPVSMDSTGRFCAFKHKDGTYSLLHNRKPLLQGVLGGIAISPNGTHIAVGQESGTKITTLQAISSRAGVTGA